MEGLSWGCGNVPRLCLTGNQMVPRVSVPKFPKTLVWDNTVLPLRCRSSSKTFSATRKVSDMLGKWFADCPHCHMERDGDDEEEQVPEEQWKRRARRDS